MLLVLTGYRESHFIFRMGEFKRNCEARWIVEQKEDSGPDVLAP